MTAGEEGMTEQGATEEAGTKVCPDCAEAVQEAARVCRYCGYQFDIGAPGGRASSPAVPPSAPSARKSAAGAAILSLVIPGLGHFYLSEGWRGGVFLATFIVATFGAFATGTIGPGWIIGIIGAIDAYSGAGSLNAQGRLREVSGGLWGMLAAVIVLVAVGVAIQAREVEAIEAAPPFDAYTDYSACVADGIYSEDECEITFGPPPAPPPAPELGDQRNYTGCILEGLPEAERRDAFP
nr:hypothetical protein [Gemmatimonadaceae bacterium]